MLEAFSKHGKEFYQDFLELLPLEVIKKEEARVKAEKEKAANTTGDKEGV